MADVTITVSRDFTLADLELITAEDMRELGLLAREQIVRRTREGKGPNGPLAPLSDGYAKRKAEALGTAAADLTVSGNMLNDLTITEVDVSEAEARVRLGWLK